MLPPASCLLISCLAATALAQAPQETDRFQAWQHHGDCWILTDAEGASLPEGKAVTDFPLLLRLTRTSLDFATVQPHGEDLRISDAAGAPLAFEIEQWDAANGIAAVWVRIPKITGAARQRVRLHWGNAAAQSASDGGQVFGAFNGYVTALHLDPRLADATGKVQLKDEGTAPCAGMRSPTSRARRSFSKRTERLRCSFLPSGISRKNT